MELENIASQACSILVHIYARHGLSINFGKGKKEIMFAFRGCGAIEASKRILIDLGALIAFRGVNGTISHVRIVQQYRHM